MLKANNKIQNENLVTSNVTSWLPKERPNIYKNEKIKTDKDSFESSYISRNEKKEKRSSQREKTLKLFDLIRNSEIGGDKFYLGPYGYKRSKFLLFFW